MAKSSFEKMCGWSSVVLSIAPWIISGAGFILRLGWLDLTANQVALLLAVAVVLAFIAAAIGSRRWVLVALFDIITVFVLVFILNMREPS